MWSDLLFPPIRWSSLNSFRFEYSFGLHIYISTPYLCHGLIKKCEKFICISTFLFFLGASSNAYIFDSTRWNVFFMWSLALIIVEILIKKIYWIAADITISMLWIWNLYFIFLSPFIRRTPTCVTKKHIFIDSCSRKLYIFQILYQVEYTMLLLGLPLD